MAKKSKKLPVAKAIDGPCAVKVDKDQERRWKAEEALKTCQRYDEIKKDKNLMKDVKNLAKEQMNALKKVAG